MGYHHCVYIGPYLAISNEVQDWIRTAYRRISKDDPDYETACTIMEMDFVFPEFVDNVAFPYNVKDIPGVYSIYENKCKDIEFNSLTSEESIAAFVNKFEKTISILRKHGKVDVKYGVISYVS